MLTSQLQANNPVPAFPPMSDEDKALWKECLALTRSLPKLIDPKRIYGFHQLCVMTGFSLEERTKLIEWSAKSGDFDNAYLILQLAYKNRDAKQLQLLKESAGRIGGEENLLILPPRKLNRAQRRLIQRKGGS